MFCQELASAIATGLTQTLRIINVENSYLSRRESRSPLPSSLSTLFLAAVSGSELPNELVSKELEIE